MTYSFQALLISLVPVFSWGIMWFFVTKATRTMELFQAQFLFQLVGIPLLLLILPFVPHMALSANLLLLLALGILETFVLTLYFLALKIGNLSIVGPVNESNVLITVFLAIVILHESLYSLKIVGIFAILLGVILLGFQLSRKKSLSTYAGVGPALISTIGTGVYVFFVGISSRLNGWYFTSLGIRIVIPLTILIIFVVQRKNIFHVFKKVPWILVIPAAFFDVLGFSTFNFALTRYDISYVSVIISATPVVSVILALLFLKEKLKWYQFIGFILIIAGIVSLNLA